MLGRGQAVESIFGRIGRIGFKEGHLVRIYINYYCGFLNGFTNFIMYSKKRKNVIQIYRVFTFFPFIIL